ncbi:thymosin beta-4-like [Desmodus rotundus]|uniref:thymosin beta-4-like n=1 Tax=Desmodus rotundus TaxID=9430 RepID=UPI000D18675C
MAPSQEELAANGMMEAGRSLTKIRLLLLTAPHSTSSTTISDKLDMVETKKFNKSKSKAEMQEKNPLPSKEMIEQEKQAGES